MRTINFIKKNGEVTNFTASLNSLISTLKNGEYSLLIKKKTKQRTISQNKLLWLWLNCIAQELGYTAQDMHDYFCTKYLSKEVYGAIIVVGTKDLTTLQFKQFLDNIKIFAATELGITLPDPEDLYFQSFLVRYEEYL